MSGARLSRRLFSRGRPPTTAAPKVLAQALALLGSHILPALPPHALPPVSMPAAPAQAAKQDPAEQQQSQRLPVLEPRSAEKLRHQRVPQEHHRDREQRQDRYHGREH